MKLSYRDWRADTAAWAQAIGVSKEAVDLYCASDVIDLHIDSFIWTRVFGYDLTQKHGTGLFGSAFYSQVDLPRALEAGLTGATWILTTNPAKPSRLRRRAFWRNLERIKGLFASVEDVQLVRTAADYRAARAAGKHAAFLGIQGGNALDADLEDVQRIPQGDILRCTVVHLTTSSLGETSAPLPRKVSGLLGRRDGLTDLGREFVERLDAADIFVDLAHISRPAFFEAVGAHDPTKPLMVTHTGVAGVYEHWRNLTDAQVKVIADSGGCVGIMFQHDFLGARDVTAETVVDHLEHVIDLVGEDVPCLGSDYDGAIVPPPGLESPFELPRLVQILLDRGHGPERIGKILGGNFLRVVESLRG